MYNEEIVKAVVKDQIKSILEQMNDSKLRNEVLMELFEEEYESTNINYIN